MGFYSKHIDKVHFYGIKHREINNVNDNFILENEIKDVMAKGNKLQFLIDAENLRNQSLEEKDRSMNINFAIVVSLLFGLISLAMGIFFEPTKEIPTFLIKYSVCLVIYITVVWVLVKRANEILKLYNAKIIFFDTICKIIRGKE